MERICTVQDLPSGEARRVEVNGHPIAIFNLSGQYYALDDICSHALSSLSEGFIEEEDFTVECPKHGSLFDVRTGAPQSLPATRPVATYPVKVENDEIFVEV
ncbi:MAG: bifunctional 3-phenylpropionate/cinnamic acid dioxygenase ferredoxin subunit [Actinomycetota bacterium]|nr:bifunctional 3-phenylpropionate/cinnamic acid dioxygenase ferredoxin subunit [Actinomycetota bacterium]